MMLLWSARNFTAKEMEFLFEYAVLNWPFHRHIYDCLTIKLSDYIILLSNFMLMFTLTENSTYHSHKISNLCALCQLDAQWVAKYFATQSYQTPMAGNKFSLHFAAGSDKCHSQAKCQKQSQHGLVNNFLLFYFFFFLCVCHNQQWVVNQRKVFRFCSVF